MSMEHLGIVASLKHGRVITGRRWRIGSACFWIILTCVAIMFLITIAMIILMLVENDWENEIAYTLIGGSIFLSLMCGLTLLLIRENKRRLNEISLWVQDVVELKAISKDMTFVSREYKPHQIQVDFEYKGQKYQKLSTPGNLRTGYHKIFTKYADREIKILYSPKYDEVLITKDKI